MNTLSIQQLFTGAAFCISYCASGCRSPKARPCLRMGRIVVVIEQCNSIIALKKLGKVKRTFHGMLPYHAHLRALARRQTFLCHLFRGATTAKFRGKVLPYIFTTGIFAAEPVALETHYGDKVDTKCAGHPSCLFFVSIQPIALGDFEIHRHEYSPRG